MPTLGHKFSRVYAEVAEANYEGRQLMGQRLWAYLTQDAGCTSASLCHEIGYAERKTHGFSKQYPIFRI